MKYDSNKHELIGNIVNRGNNSRTTVEPNLNSSFNELMKISKPFVTIVVG